MEEAVAWTEEDACPGLAMGREKVPSKTQALDKFGYCLRHERTIYAQKLRIGSRMVIVWARLGTFIRHDRQV